MYINKYNKYKQKYLQLNKQIGGAKEDIFVEFYEYLLNGYTTHNSKPHTKTLNLESSDEDECGIINVENRVIQHTQRTCDPLKGSLIEKDSTDFKEYKLDQDQELTPLLKFKININIDTITYSINSDELIKFIKIYGAKLKDRVKVNESDFSFGFLYNKTIVLQILDKIIKLLDKQWDGLNKPIHFDDVKTLILCINKQQDIEYIIFGDLHGSFSTFVRHLLRLRAYGIIDDNGIINPNYNLIFLGDIVDRGIYGYEIIMILYILKLNNPDRIYINRGNHEELSTNYSYKFHSQISIQFTQQDVSQQDVDYIYEFINRAMILQHSAILIKNRNNGKFIYLAHGGLPILDNDEEKIDINEHKNYHTDGYTAKSNLGIIIHPILKKLIQHTQHRSEEHIFTYFEDWNSTIRWSDMNPIHSAQDARRSNDFNRGPGSFIGPRIIYEAFELGIQLIIRGHQDRVANSALLINGESYRDEFNREVKLFDINKLSNKELFNDNYRIKSTANQFGIKIMKNDVLYNGVETSKTFLPVITISTNTDYDRAFNRDSFARLMIGNNKQSLKYNIENEILFICTNKMNDQTGRDLKYMLRKFKIDQALNYSNIKQQQLSDILTITDTYKIIIINTCDQSELIRYIENIKKLSKNIQKGGILYINNLSSIMEKELTQHFTQTSTEFDILNIPK